MILEIPLSDHGLETVERAAERKEWGVRSLQNWIVGGLLPAVCISEGKRRTYLLRPKDVDDFKPPRRGPKPKVPPGKKAKPRRK